MAGLLIKNVPPKLQRRLKAMAARHHRSLMREALVLLEQAAGLAPGHFPEFPPPVRGRFPITDTFLRSAKRQGRE